MVLNIRLKILFAIYQDWFYQPKDFVELYKSDAIKFYSRLNRDATKKNLLPNSIDLEPKLLEYFKNDEVEEVS